MQFERGKPPDTPNAPYRAARTKDERWLSAGIGFEPVRIGPRLSLRSSQDHNKTWKMEKPGYRASCYPGTHTARYHDLAFPDKVRDVIRCTDGLCTLRRAFPRILTTST
jgi:hypothetical protein